MTNKPKNIPEKKESLGRRWEKNILVGTIDLNSIKTPKDKIFMYQRLINNRISVVGLLKSPEPYYPYCDYDKKWNIFIRFHRKNLTGTDPKIIDTDKINTRIENLIETFPHEDKDKRNSITKKIKRTTIDWYVSQQTEEVAAKKRHAYKNIQFTVSENDKQKEQIMEWLYNLMWPKRMENFDYIEATGKCTINNKGKERILNLLYEEIDDINKHGFVSIENVFSWSDYQHIKSKQQTAEALTEKDIIKLWHYLLSGHHVIDDLIELYTEENTNKTKWKISKNLKEWFKTNLKLAIKKTSSKHRLEPIVNENRAKGHSSKLKTDRWYVSQRIAIAKPLLYNKYDFNTINEIYEKKIQDIVNNLEKQYPWVIKCIKTRKKSPFSWTNKILRYKETSEYRDQIGIQIFIDFDVLNKEEVVVEKIKEIYQTLNKELETPFIKKGTKIKQLTINQIKLDNMHLIPKKWLQTIETEIKKDYPNTEIRAKAWWYKEPITEDTNIQQYIHYWIEKWEKWANGWRKSCKEILQCSATMEDGNQKTNLGGVEAQILPHGESVNQNEGAHQFLDAQKIVDLVINTNKTCGFDTYCEKKDVAITKRANELKNIELRLKEWTEKEYTRNMFEKEKYYTMPINRFNENMIQKIKKNKNKRDKDIFHIKDNKVYINLLQLEDLSSNISKRRAADLIILDQVNKELESGKIIQYQYTKDMQKSIISQIHKNRDKDNISTIQYPRIYNIPRDEKGDVEVPDVRFINKESLTAIQSGQMPPRGYIAIPSKKDKSLWYCQKISDLARSLKSKDIKEENTQWDLCETLAA